MKTESKKSVILMVIVALLVIVFTSISSCSNTDDPRVVSTLFWEAVISNNQDKARKLSTEVSRSAVESLENDAQQLQSVEVISAELGGDKAVVKTILHGLTEEGEPVSFPTSTILVKQDKEWKVDASETVNTLMANAVENMVETMGKRFNELGSQLSNALTDGMKGFSDEINKTLPRINSQLKKLQDDEKFRDLGAQLGRSLADGIQQFTTELNEGLKELSRELDRNTEDAAKVGSKIESNKQTEASQQ